MSCLLSIDLNTTRLNNQSYQYLISSTNSNDLEIHLYNYIEQKHNKLSFVNGEIIHKYSGSRKKVALDIPQALDIIEQCASNNYETVFILCGEFESEYLLNKLEEMKVNFIKVQQTTLRQLELPVDKNNDYKNILEQNAQKNTNQNLIIEKNTSVPEDKLNNINKMIKSGDITTYTPKDKCTAGTKLTPEQIKKIYTYIKLKQLQRERNLV